VSIEVIIPAVEAASTARSLFIQLREGNHAVPNWEFRATVKERAQDVVMLTNRVQCPVHHCSDDHERGNLSELSCLSDTYGNGFG